MRYIKGNPEWQLHFCMAALGGFCGTYALTLRGGNFGSAMTGNFMEMMIDTAAILLGDSGEAFMLLIRLGAVIVFGSALVLSALLTAHTSLPMRKVTLTVETIVLILASFLPVELEPFLALYPIFFLTAFQWGTFSGVKEFGCATIFSTNNFRQCVTAWAEYAVTREEKFHRKGSFYGITILSFLTGALIGALLSLNLGPICLLAGVVLTVKAWFLNLQCEKSAKI